MNVTGNAQIQLPLFCIADQWLAFLKYLSTCINVLGENGNNYGNGNNLTHT